MEECLGVNGGQLFVGNVLLYNTFSRRARKFCNGLINLLCILEVGWDGGGGGETRERGGVLKIT